MITFLPDSRERLLGCFPDRVIPQTVLWTRTSASFRGQKHVEDISRVAHLTFYGVETNFRIKTRRVIPMSGHAPIPNLTRDRNPLRLELLPDGWETKALEFSYRTPATRGDDYQNPFTGYVVVSVGLSALLAVSVLRLFAIVVDVEAFLFSPWLFALLTIAALGEAVPSFQRDEAPSVWLFRLILPFAIWAAVVLIVQPSWILLVLLLTASLLLSDVVADHYLQYLLANPELDYDTRKLIQERWEERFGSLAWRAASWSVFASKKYPKRLFDLYPVGFVTIPLAYLLAVSVLLTHAGITVGLFVVVGLTAFLLLNGFCWRIRRVPATRSFAVTWKAFERWFNYNPRHEQAPGLHQSPYGSAVQRTATASFALIMASAGLNLSTHYFPVLMLLRGGSTPWAQVVSDWEPRPAPPKPSGAETDAVTSAEQLPAHQRIFYGQLSTDEQRTVYLAGVAERNRKKPAPRPQQTAPEEHHYAQLHQPPENWLKISFLGMSQGNALFIWSFILSVLLGVAVPPLFMFLTCWSVTSYTLGLLDLRLSHEYWQQYSRDDDAEPTESPEWYNREWLAHVDALFSSPDDLEREHLFLGYALNLDHDGQIPVPFHRPLLREHAHITGDSGSGKTARGIASIASQLIRCARERGDCSILIIDLKGDESLFHGVHAESQGLPFRWYRDFQGFSSFAFNPLGQSYFPYIDPDQQANLVMDSFGLRYGDTLGGRYFADIQQHVLRRIFRERNDITSLGALHRVLQDPRTRDDYFAHMSDREWNNAFHIREEVDAFSRREPLNRVAGPSIDMASLFVEPQVVYLYVPALLGGDANRQAAKFALYALLNSATMMSPGSRHQVYCFIDEFQQLVGTNISPILEQSRSLDVSFILSNQMLADLKQGSTDLTKTVLNTAFRWSFRTSDLDHQDQLMKASGEFIETLASTTFAANYDRDGTISGYSESTARREEYRPAFDRNSLLWASYAEDLSVAHFSKGSGYTRFFRPFPMRTMFHISEKLFQQRARRNWPEIPDDLPEPISPFEPDSPPNYQPPDSGGQT